MIFSILNFYIKNFKDKRLCREVHYLLEDCGINVIDALGDSEIISEYYEFIEYILFDPELYASNYPVPELHDDIIPALQGYIDQKDR